MAPLRSPRVALGACVLVALLACSGAATEVEAPPRAIATEIAAAETLVDLVTVVGRLEADHEARVFAELPERIATVHVSLGQRVSAGEPLVTLSGETYAAGVGQAEGALDSARANAEVVRAQVERLRVLVGAGTAARADLEAAEGQLRAAEAQVRQLGQARSQAVTQRGRVVLRAPIDGLVASLDAREGDVAAPGRVIATIVEPGGMKAILDVSERDFLRISTGMPARVTPLAGGESAEGAVVAVGALVDPVTRTGRVEVAIADGGPMISGSAARATIEVARRPDVLLVPAQSVQLDADVSETGRGTVFVVREGRAVAKRVAIGARSGDRVEIVEGLAAGDEVATLGSHLLKDGAAVAVAAAAGEAP